MTSRPWKSASETRLPLASASEKSGAFRPSTIFAMPDPPGADPETPRVPRAIPAVLRYHSVTASDRRSRDEERIPGDGQRPAHDGAGRSLGAVPRAAVQEVRADLRPEGGERVQSAPHRHRQSR